MKYLIVTRYFYPFTRPSGATSLVREIVDELSRRGEEVAVACIREDGEKESYIYGAIKVFKYRKLGIFSYKSILNEANPEKVIFISSISGGIEFIVWWGFLKNLSGRRKIALYQTTNFVRIKVRLLLRRLLLSFNKIFVASKSIKDDFLRYACVNSEVLLPGVNVTKYSEKGLHRKRRLNTIGFFGHISYFKGTDIFVEVSKRLPKFNFLLVAGKSRGSKDAILYDQILKKAKKQKNLKLIGFVKNPENFLRHCDLLILPYRTGGSILGVSQSAIEAMSFGIPVIGTHNSSLDSIIENNKNGFFCRDVNEIVEKVILLARDKKMYNNFSSVARNTATSKFNIVKVVDKLISF